MILQNWDQMCITSSFRTLPSEPVWSWTIAAGLALVGMYFLVKKHGCAKPTCRLIEAVRLTVKSTNVSNKEKTTTRNKMPIHKEKASQWLHPRKQTYVPWKGAISKGKDRLPSTSGRGVPAGKRIWRIWTIILQLEHGKKTNKTSSTGETAVLF